MVKKDKPIKVYITQGRRSSDLPPYQAFTFKWIKILLKVLMHDICISLNAFWSQFSHFRSIWILKYKEEVKRSHVFWFPVIWYWLYIKSFLHSLQQVWNYTSVFSILCRLSLKMSKASRLWLEFSSNRHVPSSGSKHLVCSSKYRLTFYLALV